MCSSLRKYRVGRMACQVSMPIEQPERVILLDPMEMRRDAEQRMHKILSLAGWCDAETDISYGKNHVCVIFLEESSNIRPFA